jgi:hypothetical protein
LLGEVRFSGPNLRQGMGCSPANRAFSIVTG